MKHTTGIIVFISLLFSIIGQLVPGKATMDPLFNSMEKLNKENRKMQDLGLKVIDLTENEKASLHLTNGIKVIEIHNGRSKHVTQMRAGFIILKVNNISIYSSDQFHEMLSRQSECSVIVEGIYADSVTIYYYAFELE